MSSEGLPTANLTVLAVLRSDLLLKYVDTGAPRGRRSDLPDSFSTRRRGVVEPVDPSAQGEAGAPGAPVLLVEEAQEVEKARRRFFSLFSFSASFSLVETRPPASEAPRAPASQVFVQEVGKTPAAEQGCEVHSCCARSGIGLR